MFKNERLFAYRVFFFPLRRIKKDLHSLLIGYVNLCTYVMIKLKTSQPTTAALYNYILLFNLIN